MKPMMLMQNKAGRWCRAALLGLTLPAFALLAADTNAPPATAPAPTNAQSPDARQLLKQPLRLPLTPEQMFEGGTNSFNNWIDLSAGGFISSGNKAQFQQRHQTSGGAFGGIEDFHYQSRSRQGHDADHGRAGYLR